MFTHFSNQGPSTAHKVIGWMVILSATMSANAQSRIINPAPQATPAANRSIATVRATDSSQGSRVTVTANRSLLDYEAYRQGDRFYVRIPAAEVPRAEAVRGRGFGDVRVQRGTNDTVLSFRLQPGATARVEQRGNKLDVVFAMPGSSAGSSSPAGRDVARNDADPAPPPTNSKARGSATSNLLEGSPSDRSGIRNAAETIGTVSARPSPTPRSDSSPKPSPAPSAKPSATPDGAPIVAQRNASPSPATTVSSSQPASQGTTWNKLKQRARYWILLAQLNPVPVGIGIAVLLSLVGFLVMQRRRDKGARRGRARQAARADEAGREVKPAKSALAAVSGESPTTDAALIGTAAVADVTAATTDESIEPAQPVATHAQHERITRASEEVKKLMAGGDYDETIITSEDRYTRQMVGAELLSALVGRNVQRRERARAAFMNHGYFDDATRDLRIAESPNERAAAARRLSFVHDREATPHLIAALEDSSPDVRRASVEALMDLRDPAAIAPLNSLMQTETDRRVPCSLIKHAIEACATSGSVPAASAAESPLTELASTPISQTADYEREVIVI